MFKKGHIYEVLMLSELCQQAKSKTCENEYNYYFTFPNVPNVFSSNMKHLCGHQFKCEEDCEWFELDHYYIYPHMCKEVPNINHPTHYNSGDHETIDVIESLGWGTGFNLGNALKYIMRCEHKENKVSDLKKAIWYLQRELKEEN